MCSCLSLLLLYTMWRHAAYSDSYISCVQACLSICYKCSIGQLYHTLSDYPCHRHCEAWEHNHMHSSIPITHNGRYCGLLDIWYLARASTKGPSPTNNNITVAKMMVCTDLLSGYTYNTIVWPFSQALPVAIGQLEGVWGRCLLTTVEPVRFAQNTSVNILLTSACSCFHGQNDALAT